MEQPDELSNSASPPSAQCTFKIIMRKGFDLEWSSNAWHVLSELSPKPPPPARSEWPKASLKVKAAPEQGLAIQPGNCWSVNVLDEVCR